MDFAEEPYYSDLQTLAHRDRERKSQMPSHKRENDWKGRKTAENEQRRAREDRKRRKQRERKKQREQRERKESKERESAKIEKREGGRMKREGAQIK